MASKFSTIHENIIEATLAILDLASTGGLYFLMLFPELVLDTFHAFQFSFMRARQCPVEVISDSHYR